MKTISKLSINLFVFASLLLTDSFLIIAQVSNEAQVDQLFSQWNDPRIPGASIAIIQDGEIIFEKGYGCANLEYGIPIGPATVFHVASVSKQVTVFAVLLLEREGKLSMDDDIRKYVPEVPDFGQKITLRQLANHTSGLRDQWTLLMLAGWRLDDVITQEQILKIISRQKGLNFRPGDEHMYCNTGYTLLAEVVSRVSGKTFAEYTSENIFKPLKMDNTLFYDDHEKIVNDRAYSYKNNGAEYKKSVLNYANVGATSLFTTADDMAKWALNFDQPVVGDKLLMSKMMEKGILNNGDTISYALGQDIGQYRGLLFINHGGADAGYRAFLGRFPDQHFAVAVLSNNASFDPAGVAIKVAEIYLKDQMKPEIKNEAVPVKVSNQLFSTDAEMLKVFSGEFQLRPGFNVYFTAENDKLFVEAHELPKRPMTQISAADFTVPGLDAKISFIKDSRGKTDTIRILLNGQQFLATRVQKIDISTLNLKEYEGHFYSPELNTFYVLEAVNDKLYSRHIRNSDAELSIAGRDLFTSGFNTIQFIRNTANEITGFSITTGRVRNLLFEKQN